MTGPALLKLKEYSAESGIRERSLRKLIAAGTIRSVRIGRAIYVPRTELEDFIRRNVQPPPAQDDGDGPED